MPGFTQAQLVAYVMQGLGFRTDLSTQILTMATMVQYDELEKGTTLPRFLLVEDVPIAGLANNPLLTVPSDFIREYNDEGALKYIDASTNTTIFLDKKPYDWLVEWAEGISASEDENEFQISIGVTVLPTGIPGWYSLRNKTLYISPIPTADFSLYMTYYAHDVDPAGLTAGQTNKWLTNAPGMLANLVGVKMAEDLEYDKAMSKFQSRFEASMKRMLFEEAAAEAANNEFIMGELV